MTEKQKELLRSREYYQVPRVVTESAEAMPQPEGNIFSSLVSHYAWTGELPDWADDFIDSVPGLKFLWPMAKDKIDFSHKQYLNGKKGGAPHENQNASKNNPKTTQKQPYEYEYEYEE